MRRWFGRGTADARWNYSQRASAAPDGESLDRYSITVALGGFGPVDVGWLGSSREDARDGFLEWLHNDEEFADGLRFPHFRSLYVRFNGRRMLLTFRTDWIAGFTVR